MMKTQTSLSVIAGLIAGSAAIAASTLPAQAASFTANDAGHCVGLAACTVNGFNLSATRTGDPAGAQMVVKTVNGFKGIGIRSANPATSDPSGGEIDLNETLSVDFGKLRTLKYFDLSFLYQPGVFNDSVFEVALVTANGILQPSRLRITGNTSAIWETQTAPNVWTTLTGTVQNLSPSLGNGGGAYRVLNPFGDVKISGFSLTAQQAKNPTTGGIPGGGANSDFALAAVQVPEPTTVLGLGVVGLLATARKRKISKA